MVILSDSGTSEDWVLTVSDYEGNNLYSLSPSDRLTGGLLAHPVDFSEEGVTENTAEKIVLSFINDDRGFFLSSSADSGMAGPFAFQEALNIKIAAGSDESVNDIRNIRFFQD